MVAALVRRTADRVASVFGYHRVPPKVPAEPAEKTPPPSDAREWGRRTAERLRTAVLSGVVRFPQWLNPLAGETRAMVEAYDAMLAEPMILTPLMVTVDGVASQDVQILADDPEDEAQKELADFHRWNLKNIAGGKLGMVRAVALPAKVRGWSVTEKVWDRVADDTKWRGWWYWREWKDKDATKLRLNPVTDEFGNLTGITSGLDPGHEFDPADFVVYSHLKMFSNHRGRSALLAAYRDWWLKQAAVQLWGIGLEKWGSPMLVGKYSDEANQRASLEAALEDAGANKWLSVPVACAVEAVAAATSSTADWDAYVARCDKGMLIGTMGSHLAVMEGQNKNVAGDSRTQKGTAELFQWSLAEELSCLWTWHGRELSRVNRPGVPSPTYVFGAVSEADIKAMLENDDVLQGMGLDLSKQSLRQRTGREAPRDSADTLPGKAMPAFTPAGFPKLAGANGVGGPAGAKVPPNGKPTPDGAQAGDRRVE
jgi:hypothetical protein